MLLALVYGKEKIRLNWDPIEIRRRRKVASLSTALDQDLICTLPGEYVHASKWRYRLCATYCDCNTIASLRKQIDHGFSVVASLVDTWYRGPLVLQSRISLRDLHTTAFTVMLLLQQCSKSHLRERIFSRPRCIESPFWNWINKFEQTFIAQRSHPHLHLWVLKKIWAFMIHVSDKKSTRPAAVHPSSFAGPSLDW